eukprot:7177832-Prymnesium_polylepis.1
MWVVARAAAQVVGPAAAACAHGPPQRSQAPPRAGRVLRAGARSVCNVGVCSPTPRGRNVR